MKLLNYCKYLVGKGGWRESPNSEVTLKIQNNYNYGINSQRDITNFNIPKVYVIDDNELNHKINVKKFITFGDFVETFFKRIMLNFKQSHHVKRIVLIFGKYDDISIKFLESHFRRIGQIIKIVLFSKHSTQFSTDYTGFF